MSKLFFYRKNEELVYEYFWYYIFFFIKRGKCDGNKCFFLQFGRKMNREGSEGYVGEARFVGWQFGRELLWRFILFVVRYRGALILYVFRGQEQVGNEVFFQFSLVVGGFGFGIVGVEVFQFVLFQMFYVYFSFYCFRERDIFSEFMRKVICQSSVFYFFRFLLDCLSFNRKSF